MQKLIKNRWTRKRGDAFERAQILTAEIHPEGLDVDRMRFYKSGSLTPCPDMGHIISVVKGRGKLSLPPDKDRPLGIQSGVHIYLPPDAQAVIHAQAGTELVLVSSASTVQARGTKFLLRDEEFLSACAHRSQSLRWVLTPQYLSRRVFLHHDQTLLSKRRLPVSWFRTTMFDVAGLPQNEDGEPVFKMSYNYRTEPNICYEVEGQARVRMARHPYTDAGQLWDEWLPLDNEATYHLNEGAGSPQEEWRLNPQSGKPEPLRNKHEVHIVDGHVTLFCLFDPAPTGIEHHRAGEYSDYGPLSDVLGTEAYQAHQHELEKFDQMVHELSLAKAKGRLNDLQRTPMWQFYIRGREAQLEVEKQLFDVLTAQGNGREQVLARWLQPRYVGVAA